MQGYYQVSSFHLPVDLDDDDKDNAKAVVDYVIASRRSRDRAGLRYQRRGVDDDAHVANFVETETTMRVKVYVCYRCKWLFKVTLAKWAPKYLQLRSNTRFQ